MSADLRSEPRLDDFRFVLDTLLGVEGSLLIRRLVSSSD